MEETQHLLVTVTTIYLLLTAYSLLLTTYYLQDAYVAETQHFAAKAAGLAKAPVLRALSKMRFQNAGLKTQLEQNR